ncbi:hypothetical protein N7463_008307 [Penicillium fimorum]|uniref:Uncharacterized protein n=1 Tax=Penicillium fimorum TaxID=1882269 RepID=A0A9W9XPG2_9EURO|nr:hypothetical protein N7463_008307 [Penicillium fimorum]
MLHFANVFLCHPLQTQDMCETSFYLQCIWDIYGAFVVHMRRQLADTFDSPGILVSVFWPWVADSFRDNPHWYLFTVRFLSWEHSPITLSNADAYML